MTTGDCSNWCIGTGVGSANSSVHSKCGMTIGYLDTLHDGRQFQEHEICDALRSRPHVLSHCTCFSSTGPAAAAAGAAAVAILLAPQRARPTGERMRKV